jgi:hypothetical protein
MIHGLTNLKPLKHSVGRSALTAFGSGYWAEVCGVAEIKEHYVFVC